MSCCHAERPESSGPAPDRLELPAPPAWQRWLAPLLLVMALGFWVGFVALVLWHAALSDDASGTVVVVYPRALDDAEQFLAVLDAGGRLVQTTWLDNIWVVHGDEPGFVARLKHSGATAAFSYQPFQPVMAGGCFFALPPTVTAGGA